MGSVAERWRWECRRVTEVTCNIWVSVRLTWTICVRDCEASQVVWYGYGTNDNKTRGRFGFSRSWDVAFFISVMRLDKIRNEPFGGTEHVHQFGDKAGEAKLRWFCHVWGKDKKYMGKRKLNMDPPGRRKWGRRKRRFMEVVQDLWVVGIMKVQKRKVKTGVTLWWLFLNRSKKNST